MYKQSLLEDYRKHTILAIDPGTNFMGIAIYSLDHLLGSFQLETADTVLVEKYVYRHPSLQYLADTRSLLEARLEAVSTIVYELCCYYQVESVVCEDIYFQRIHSYRTMSEGLHAVRVGVQRYSMAIELELIPPREVKAGVGVSKNNGDKELMRVAVVNLLKDKLTPNVTLDSMTEHAIDAIAIGYGWLTNGCGGRTNPFVVQR